MSKVEVPFGPCDRFAGRSDQESLLIIVVNRDDIE